MNSPLVKKLALLTLALVAVAAFWFFELHHFLSLEYLKQQQGTFHRMYRQGPALFLLGYGLVYVLVAAFSLPGAAVLTLAGGGLFGLGWGLVTVSFASAIGATLACFFARYVLRESIQRKFGKRLAGINRGMEKEGAFYLFTLRLVPVFPFFIVNLVMGLTPIRLWTFYWVSQLGMLPATVAYVNAGRELARIQSPADIISPRLIISFAVLGLLPLLVKKGLSWYRARQEKTAGQPTEMGHGQD